MAKKEAGNLLNMALHADDDYVEKRKILAEKIKRLYIEEDLDEGEYDNELDFQKSIISDPSKPMSHKIDMLLTTKSVKTTHDDQSTVELARQMVQKLQDEKRERKRELRERKKRIKEHNEKYRAKRDAPLIEAEQQEQEEYQEMKQRRMKSIEDRKERIKQSKNEMKEETKKRVRHSPLHSKIEDSFHSNYTMPELEKRKQTLASIRNFYQPIRLREIKAHSEQKRELLKTKLQEYLQRRDFYAKKSKDFSDYHKSKFWEIVK